MTQATFNGICIERCIPLAEVESPNFQTKICFKMPFCRNYDSFRIVHTFKSPVFYCIDPVYDCNILHVKSSQKHFHGFQARKRFDAVIESDEELFLKTGLLAPPFDYLRTLDTGLKTVSLYWIEEKSQMNWSNL